ncbi:MAG: VOC family protein [Dehalococcoidia bacterium]|nr:VOC family protein [Dehalococcoidia bacterium]
MSDRPFRVLGVQQVALGALNKDDFKPFWLDILGLSLTGNYKAESENVDEDIAVAGSGPFKVEFDLMQPIDAEKKPAVHNPTLNHIGLWIDDLHAAVDWMTAKGVRFTPGGIRKGASGFDVCFVHPKGSEETPIAAGGVLVELVQAPPEVVDAFTRFANA